jgi:hypothetical protein
MERIYFIGQAAVGNAKFLKDFTLMAMMFFKVYSIIRQKANSLRYKLFKTEREFAINSNINKKNIVKIKTGCNIICLCFGGMNGNSS